MFPGKIIVDNIIMGGNPNDYMDALGPRLNLDEAPETVFQWLRTQACVSWAFQFCQDKTNICWDQFFDESSEAFNSEENPIKLYQQIDRLASECRDYSAALFFLLKSPYTEDIHSIAEEKNNLSLADLCLLSEQINGWASASQQPHSRILIPAIYPLPSIYGNALISNSISGHYNNAEISNSFNTSNHLQIQESFRKISDAIQGNYGSTQNIGQASSRPMQEILFLQHSKSDQYNTHLTLSRNIDISDSIFDNYFRATPLSLNLTHEKSQPALNTQTPLELIKQLSNRVEECDILLALTQNKGLSASGLSKTFAELNKRNIENIFHIVACALSESLDINQTIEIASLIGMNSFHDALNVCSVTEAPAINQEPTSISFEINI